MKKAICHMMVIWSMRPTLIKILQLNHSELLKCWRGQNQDWPWNSFQNAMSSSTIFIQVIQKMLNLLLKHSRSILSKKRKFSYWFLQLLCGRTRPQNLKKSSKRLRSWKKDLMENNRLINKKESSGKKKLYKRMSMKTLNIKTNQW